MSVRKLVRRYWKVLCVNFACWTFLALLFTPQIYLTNLRSPMPLTWEQALLSTLILFYVWAALTPLVLWLGLRFSFERQKLWRNLAIHLLLSGALALLHIWLLQQINTLALLWSRSNQPLPPLAALLVGLGATNILVYWGIVTVGQAVSYFRKYQEREFRLTQAELQALKMQLHPHFLFNTLNAIAELVHSDPVTADRSIVRLSELLRFSLAGEKAQEVALKKEVDFLEKYIEIQRTLMRDRLRVRIEMAADALDALVPNMLLQPLVENAIKHGLSPKPEGGQIVVSARRLDGHLELEIKDDGLGMPEREEEEDLPVGVGLVNTRERLKYLYGDAHAFDLSSTRGQGVSVRIRIPFKEDQSDDTDADY